MLWLKALTWLGGIDVGSIAKLALSAYKQRTDTQLGMHKVDEETRRDIVVQNIQADIRANELQQQLALADRSDWMTRWIRPAFSLLVFFYFGALVFDAVFHLELQVTPLAYPYDYLAAGIIAALFALRPLEKRGRADLVAKSK
jgi:hypothetical protein